jgi:excisionase family DNA binding protein
MPADPLNEILLPDPLSGLPRIAVDEPTAARLLNVSPKTLYRLRTAGELPFFRAGDGDSKILYRVAAIEHFAKSRERTG